MPDLREKLSAYYIGHAYKLRVITAVQSGANAVFNMESDFIPVETLQIVNTTDFGTINGSSVGVRNLVKIFDLYESIPLLLQNIQGLELSEFTIQAGTFIPEPSVSSTINLATTNYYLFYLQKR